MVEPDHTSIFDSIVYRLWYRCGPHVYALARGVPLRVFQIGCERCSSLWPGAGHLSCQSQFVELIGSRHSIDHNVVTTRRGEMQMSGSSNRSIRAAPRLNLPCASPIRAREQDMTPELPRDRSMLQRLDGNRALGRPNSDGVPAVSAKSAFLGLAGRAHAAYLGARLRRTAHTRELPDMCIPPRCRYAASPTVPLPAASSDVPPVAEWPIRGTTRRRRVLEVAAHAAAVPGRAAPGSDVSAQYGMATCISRMTRHSHPSLSVSSRAR